MAPFQHPHDTHIGIRRELRERYEWPLSIGAYLKLRTIREQVS